MTASAPLRIWLEDERGSLSARRRQRRHFRFALLNEPATRECSVLADRGVKRPSTQARRTPMTDTASPGKISLLRLRVLEDMRLRRLA